MNKKVSKKYLNRDTCIYTIATFLFYWLINIVFVNLNFLDHDYQSKEDSDINDLVYSKFKRVASANKKNTEILLVNVGNANREEIATMIDSIAIKNPKIIALDISFSSLKETLNTHLANSLKKNKDKIVLGGHFEYGNSKFVTVEKGSICVNGISLTVVDSGKKSFSVAIIPYTLENTNLKTLKVGGIVNVEFDIIGKYVQRMSEDKH